MLSCGTVCEGLKYVRGCEGEGSWRVVEVRVFGEGELELELESWRWRVGGLNRGGFPQTELLEEVGTSGH